MLAHRKSRMKKLIKKEYFMSFKEYSCYSREPHKRFSYE